MELEVGMYVRTKKGIAKVKSMYAEPNQYIVYTDRDIVFEYYLNNKSKWVVDDIVSKYSFNIIDLIEVGDIVVSLNGANILEYNLMTLSNIDELKDLWNIQKNIKSIVTKEQIEAMQYKVGE